MSNKWTVSYEEWPAVRVQKVKIESKHFTTVSIEGDIRTFVRLGRGGVHFTVYKEEAQLLVDELTKILKGEVELV